MSKMTPQVRCQGRSNCFACGLRHEMVCSDVSLDDLIDFHAGIEDFDYEHGSAIYNMGSPMEAVYCVRGGAVKMVRYDPAGEQRIVRVLKTGDVAGIESAFAEKFEHTAIAVGKVRACRIPIAYFRKFVEDHGGLQMRLLRKSQEALREAETWLSQLMGGTTPARTRMARLFLRLRAAEGGDKIHRFSLEDIAAIIGITPETASRVISDFVRQGILVKGGSTYATRYFRGDIPALEKISQEA